MTSRIDWTGFAFPKAPRPPRLRQTRASVRARFFRDAVWVRNAGCDRATGQRLYRGHANPDLRGEVCHLRGRNVRPEWKFDPDHAILLSARHHRLSDARGGRLLHIDGDDAQQPLTFTLRDRKGRIVWRHTR